MGSVTHAKVSTKPDKPYDQDVRPSDWNAGHVFDLATADIKIDKLGSPTVDKLDELLAFVGSSGYYSGGAITNAGGGNINIAAGKGTIRATATETDPLLSFEWGAFAGIAVPSNTVRYVYIVYNAGSPTYSLSADEFAEAADTILIGVAINESGSIVFAGNVGVRLQEGIGRAGRFLRRVLGIARDMRRGGLLVGETGTRNITLSAGRLWWGRTEYSIAALNTAIAGSFDRYYRDGAGGWTKEAAQTQWPNTKYDDGSGTLATITGNKWSNLWFYIELDGDVVMLYGQNQFTSQDLAEDEGPPSSVPPRIQGHGVLAAKLIFQKSAATADSILSAFATVFAPSASSSGITTESALRLALVMA